MKKITIIIALISMFLSGNSFAGWPVPTPANSSDAIPKSYFESYAKTIVQTNELATSIADSEEGDVLLLGKGTYYLGDYAFTNAGITLVGSGSGETVVSGNFDIYPSAIGLTIKDLAFAAADEGDDVVIFQAHTTNDMSVTFQNVLISGGTNAVNDSNHGIQISGANIVMDNVRSESGNFHPFVFKGVSNCVARGCSSVRGDGFSGLLVKSSDQRGQTYALTVDGFRSDGHLYIESYDDGNIVSNTLVRNSSFEAKELTDYSMVFGNSSSAIGTRKVYADIQNCSIKGGKGIQLLGCSGVVNINGLSGNTETAFMTSGGASEITANIDAVELADYTVNRSSVLSYDCAIPYYRSFSVSDDVSSGVESNNVRAEASTSTSAVIVVDAGYEFKSSLLEAGDPVWCYGSYGAGVHDLLSWGTVTTDDVPVTGALVGDFWFSLDTTSTVTGNSYRPGKLVCSVAGLAVGYRRFSVEAEAYAYESGTISWSKSQEFNSFTTGTSALTSVGGVAILKYSSFVDIYVHSYDEDNLCYVGVFGGAGEDAYVPTTFSTINVEVSVRGNFTNWQPDFKLVE